MQTAQQAKSTLTQHPDNKGAKKLVLGCGALVYELVELIKHNSAVNHAIDLHCLPASLHNTPQLIAGQVDKFLSENAHGYAEVLVAYGDCGTAGELDKVLLKHDASRIDGAHCYEFFASSQNYQAIIDDQLGSFFLTDFLVKFFDRLVIEGLGIDRHPELKSVYFKHYTQLVYIAQTEDPKLQQQAQAHAQTLGLAYHYQYVGFEGLSPAAKLPGHDSTHALGQHSKLAQIKVQHVPT